MVVMSARDVMSSLNCHFLSNRGFFTVTGAGFPGFWFHLGLLQDNPSLRECDFYCYSSGCLSK